MFWLLFQAVLGLTLLLFCADYVVRGAVRLARKLGLSTLVIGLTVVAFGTSAPEFVTALSAALAGSPDMAAGNVIGSNIANLLFILAVAALARPLLCNRQAIKRDAIAMLATTLLFIGLVFLDGLSLWHGLALVLLLVFYILHTYRAEHRIAATEAVHMQEAEEVSDVPESLWKAAALLTVGLAGIIIGADLLVRGGAGIARLAGVSETVIGLTLVAFGTSLPELATAIMASRRNHGDVAIGNILGSNIFNLLGIAGGVALITTLPVPAQILTFDIWILLIISILAVALLLSRRTIGRPTALILLLLYFAYIFLQVSPLRGQLGVT